MSDIDESIANAYYEHNQAEDTSYYLPIEDREAAACCYMTRIIYVLVLTPNAFQNARLNQFSRI